MRGLGLTALCISIGCVPASVVNQTTPEVRLEVVMLKGTSLPSLPTGSEVTLLSEMPSSNKFEEIALVAATTDTGTYTRKGFDTILPHLNAEAIALGANAIVVKSIELGDSPTWNQYNSRTPTKVYCVLIKIHVQ